MGFSAALWAIFIVCCALGCALALSKRVDHKFFIVIWLFGLFFSLLKIYVVSLAPQWIDTPPDMQTYQMHARALWAHWSGKAVDAWEFSLIGYLRYHDTDGFGILTADRNLSYHSILGTHEWLYSGYLAIWWGVTQEQKDFYFFAIASNAVFAATSIAAANGIARELGASRAVGALAAGLSALDPSAAVNCAWLLKDSMATAFALIAVWAVMVMLRRPNYVTAMLLIVALGSLGAQRFVGFLAIGAAAGIVVVWALIRSRIVVAVATGSALIASAMLFSLIYMWPFGDLFEAMGNALAALILPVQAAQATLVGDSDPAVNAWVASWEDPIIAALRAVARTLFAPYPWVVLTHGLDWKSGSELYYAGSIWWILSLPGVVMGVMLLAKPPRLGTMFLFIMLAALIGAYLVVFGEWSTRQRAFLLPIFFVFSAIGYADWARRRSLFVKQRRAFHVWLDRLFGPDLPRSDGRCEACAGPHGGGHSGERS